LPIDRGFPISYQPATKLCPLVQIALPPTRAAALLDCRIDRRSRGNAKPGDLTEIAVRLYAMIKSCEMRKHEIACEIAGWFVVIAAIAVAFMGLLLLLIYAG